MRMDFSSREYSLKAWVGKSCVLFSPSQIAYKISTVRVFCLPLNGWMGYQNPTVNVFSCLVVFIIAFLAWLWVLYNWLAWYFVDQLLYHPSTCLLEKPCFATNFCTIHPSNWKGFNWWLLAPATLSMAYGHGCQLPTNFLIQLGAALS